MYFIQCKTCLVQTHKSIKKIKRLQTESQNTEIYKTASRLVSMFGYYLKHIGYVKDKLVKFSKKKKLTKSEQKFRFGHFQDFCDICTGPFTSKRTFKLNSNMTLTFFPLSV